jgi:Protein of unknown function (DUF4238)
MNARDLKFIVLRNRTAVDFITSDNPAVITNRFSFERGDKRSFGIINSGIILTLPLTPRLLAFYFDIGIYSVSIPRGTRFVEITDTADVVALNRLQCLHANKNLYFSNWEHRESVTKDAETAKKAREKITHEITTLVRDHSVPGQAYREGSEEEQDESNELMIKASFVAPQPALWPGFLKYRPKPIMFNNNTAVGNARKEEWLRA